MTGDKKIYRKQTGTSLSHKNILLFLLLAEMKFNGFVTDSASVLLPDVVLIGTICHFIVDRRR